MTAGRKIKYGVYGLEILILFVFQGLYYLPIFGERPVLLLAALITISLLEPETPALFFGLAGGVFLDLSAGGPMGISAMTGAVICCLISVVIKRKIHVTMLSAMLTGAWALGVYMALDWLFRYVLPGYSLPLTALVNNYVPRYFYTLLIIPLAYLLNLGLYMGFRPVED